MKSLAIITARGGSKRIPRKNIKGFCGKPIIAYSIESALKSGCFEDVIVSTDDEEIKNIAISYGASVPFLRSKKNSDDYSTTADVLNEVISELNEKGNNYDILACIYPTAPFITSSKITQAFELFENSNAHTLISVVRFSYPPQRGLYLNNGNLKMVTSGYETARSQDLEPIYHDAGQFYFARIPYFVKNNSLFTDKTIPYVLSELEVQDIDTLEDWEIAEIKYNKLINK